MMRAGSRHVWPFQVIPTATLILQLVIASVMIQPAATASAQHTASGTYFLRFTSEVGLAASADGWLVLLRR
jgi:hypothetical protein